MHEIPKPTAEHLWLAQLVGEWEIVSSGGAEPCDPSQEIIGRETVSMLGDLWLTSSGEGRQGNGPLMRSLMVLGYDEQAGRFVGNFYASTMAFLWTYRDGQLNADRTALTLTAEGPGPEPGSMATYEDIIELAGPDARSLCSRSRNADGTWQEFMRIDYRRV